MDSRGWITAVVVAACLMQAGCQPSPPPQPAVGERLENPSLGLAIASLPEPFEAAGSDGGGWVFTAPGPAGDGRLVVTLGPVQTRGVNLVEAVKKRRTWFEETEGAQYFGNRELAGPIGTIFTARGTYPAGDGVVEETTAYAVHPDENRLLTVTYTYPTGESGTRVEQLLAFLGEIEGLGSDDAE